MNPVPDLDISYEEMDRLPSGAVKACQYMVSALVQQGETNHMTWCVEQALRALGYSVFEIRGRLKLLGYDWEDGVAP